MMREVRTVKAKKSMDIIVTSRKRPAEAEVDPPAVGGRRRCVPGARQPHPTAAVPFDTMAQAYVAAARRAGATGESHPDALRCVIGTRNRWQ